VTGFFGMNTDNLLFAGNANGTLYATIMCGMASAFALVMMRWFGLTNPKDDEPSKPPRSVMEPSRPADRSL